jgi:hypothetical protein
MNQKVYGRKWSWPNLRHYPRICLERLSIPTGILSQDVWFFDQDLNLGLPKYEAEVVIISFDIWSKLYMNIMHAT